MSNITLSSQQLTSGPSQLAKTQGTSSPASLAKDVLITQLVGNRLSLAVKGQEIQLPLQHVKGQLVNGKQYKAVLLKEKTDTSNMENVLKFFDATKTSPSLTLPPDIAKLLLSQVSPILLATAANESKNLSVLAKVIEANGNQLTVDIKGQKLRLMVVDAGNKYRPGQRIEIALKPTPESWQVQIVKPNSSGIPAQLNKSDLGTLLQSAIPSNQTLKIRTQELSPVINKISDNVVRSSIQDFIRSQPNILQFKPDSKGGLQFVLPQPKPIASLPVNDESVGKLQKIDIPMFKLGTKDALINTTSAQNISPKPVLTQSPLQSKVPESITVSSKETTINTQVESEFRPNTNLPKPTTAMESKPQLGAMRDLLRQLQPQADKPIVTLKRIEAALADPLISTNPELKQLTEQVLQKIQQGLPQGKEQDVQRIQQIITAPPLNLNASILLSPPAPQGFMAGLVTLLQVSLASRLVRDQPSKIEKLSEAIATILPSIKSSVKTQARKSLSDFLQTDQKHQLLKEIGKIFANHQSIKISNAEQQLQGQEGLYYALPIGQGENRKDIELLIRREPEQENDNKKQKLQGKCWKLTMKLTLNELGEVLAKASLNDRYLELDFYTSNDDTRIQILNFLPLLKKRFDSLGIELGSSKCQLGKIPDSLQKRPYQLFEAKA